jgi:hypothetical protein
MDTKRARISSPRLVLISHRDDASSQSRLVTSVEKRAFS